MTPFFTVLYTCFIIMVIMASVSVSLVFAQLNFLDAYFDNKIASCDPSIPNNPCIKTVFTKEVCFKIKQDMIDANNTANNNFNNDASNPLVPTILDREVYNDACANMTGALK
jgi:hypothetical protein